MADQHLIRTRLTYIVTALAGFFFVACCAAFYAVCRMQSIGEYITLKTLSLRVEEARMILPDLFALSAIFLVVGVITAIVGLTPEKRIRGVVNERNMHK